MKYKNKDYYDYIIKCDKENDPLYKTYQQIISMLVKEGLDEPLMNMPLIFSFKFLN